MVVKAKLTLGAHTTEPRQQAASSVNLNGLTTTRRRSTRSWHPCQFLERCPKKSPATIIVAGLSSSSSPLAAGDAENVSSLAVVGDFHTEAFQGRGQFIHFSGYNAERAFAQAFEDEGFDRGNTRRAVSIFIGLKH